MKQVLTNDCSVRSAIRIYSAWQNRASARSYEVIHPARPPGAPSLKLLGERLLSPLTDDLKVYFGDTVLALYRDWWFNFK